jgi:hypothetical protein
VSAGQSERPVERPWSALAAQALRAARAVQLASEDQLSDAVVQPEELSALAALAPLELRIEAARAEEEL